MPTSIVPSEIFGRSSDTTGYDQDLVEQEIVEDQNNNRLVPAISKNMQENKVLLLAFLALSSVEYVYGHHHDHPLEGNHYIPPHELHPKHFNGKKKLNTYRHKRWGGIYGHDQRRTAGFDVRGGGQKQQGGFTATLQEWKDDETTLFDQVFSSHHHRNHNDQESAVDFSDSQEQVRVLKHHYMNEFGHHISVNEVIKDYSSDCMIHLVIDNTPHTYKGHDGIIQTFKDLYEKIPHDTSHFVFEHVSINNNHAQVVWKAIIPDRQVIIRGMDSFAFDNQNKITNQSIMATTIPQK